MKTRRAYVTMFAFILAFHVCANEIRMPVDATSAPGSNHEEFIISRPGIYYFSTNLVVAHGAGIEIAATNVILDLNGFALVGDYKGVYIPQGFQGGYGTGLYIPAGSSNVVIRNGTICGWNGFAINCFADNVTFEYLAISSNAFGMACDYPGSDGQRYWINALATNGVNSNWVYSSSGVVVRNCRADHNGFTGICIGDNGVVSGCLSTSNLGNGISVHGSGCLIISNSCIGNNKGNYLRTAGIAVSGDNNRIEGNRVSGTGVAGDGISIPYSADSVSNPTNNIIIRNFVEGNGIRNYFIN
ncbi:MAG TPA: right-handed parallel beta-helix repeat-containing protein, partial [Verrucomicrobiae bacterium]|nr:right-handed parallel beta-helix repeat-containing protein [Verrucomicrobiae bacterium]